MVNDPNGERKLFLYNHHACPELLEEDINLLAGGKCSKNVTLPSSSSLLKSGVGSRGWADLDLEVGGGRRGGGGRQRSRTCSQGWEGNDNNGNRNGTSSPPPQSSIREPPPPDDGFLQFDPRIGHPV